MIANIYPGRMSEQLADLRNDEIWYQLGCHAETLRSLRDKGVPPTVEIAWTRIASHQRASIWALVFFLEWVRRG